MIIPVVDRWTAGSQPNETTFNKVMSVIDFLAHPPEGYFVQVAPAQSIPDITWTAVQFNTVVVDTEASYDSANPMWSVGGGNTKIYIRTKGWYEIEMFSSWANAADAQRRIQVIRQDGAADTEYRGREDQYNAGVTTTIRSAYDMFIDAGSYLEMLIYHDAGVSVSFADGGTNGFRTSLKLKWYSL